MAEKLAAQEPVLGGEGPALSSRVRSVVKGQCRPLSRGRVHTLGCGSCCPLVPALSSNLRSFWKLCELPRVLSAGSFIFLGPSEPIFLCPNT